MKSVFRVVGMRTCKDVSKIKNAIANNEGIVACQINKENSQVEIIYDDYFVNEDTLMECIERLGYTVI
ncbi:heavy-metal-associated domain-containing protein [Haloimpatiens massiliensis]|uniref:heavy-metal-associated domain-containing protein n=1 Tax=Haloimpatiens massiliensis TaxID=1658110 RepID=UPI000C822EDF|nr:heavy-metal-associated domain-containing protein [Haloimpatiens massiliensis]